MLHLYRRHVKACPHRSTANRRCPCPIYVKGTLAGEWVKKSLDLNDWDAAQKLLGAWQKDGKIGGLVPEGSTTIQDAVTAFLADLKARGLAADTIKKYVVLLEGRLIPWAHTDERTTLLRGLPLDVLTRFRTTWPDAPLAKQKNQERLKAFIGWCARRGWLTDNPALGLSKIKVRSSPTLPFLADDMGKILAAVDRYPTFNQYGHDNRARVRAFVLTLRWSGLRIRDVVTLSWDRLQDGKLRLYTQKTGQHVHIPLPAVCTSALDVLRGRGAYPFWSGNGLPKSAVADWQRSLRTLFDLAGLTGAHAHRFRDTFAVELLMQGVDLTDVSILLGHSSIRVTEKHYAPWVAARQTRLEHVVATAHRAAFAPPAPTGSTGPSSAQTESAPASIAAPPDGGPAPRPTAECASPDQTSSRPARTGTDDEYSPVTRPRLRLVSSRTSEAR